MRLLDFLYMQARGVHDGDSSISSSCHPYVEAAQGKPGLAIRYLDRPTSVALLQRWRRPEGLAQDPPAIGFMKAHPEFFLLPLDDVNGEIHGWILRSVVDKGFHSEYFTGLHTAGLWGFKGFAYGKPIVMVEGYKDVLAVQRFHPYALASLTGRVSHNLVEFLKKLTNRLVLIRDNDETGRRMARHLQDCGIQTAVVTPPHKDAGDLFSPEYASQTDAFLRTAVATFC